MTYLGSDFHQWWREARCLNSRGQEVVEPELVVENYLGVDVVAFFVLRPHIMSGEIYGKRICAFGVETVYRYECAAGEAAENAR